MGALRPGYEVTRELTLVRRLGAGGMGTVWLASHNKLKTDVVVKFLSEALASDAEACARFEREVHATLQVRSPHVVQTLDHGITESGIPYLVLEWLEGHDLAKEMRARGPLRPDEIMHVVEGLASALTKAHERGIVHRDIKPANVFLVNGSPRPFVKLVDFGIAKRLEDETMTATNALLGTPAYMSPEQMDGTSPVDHRTDLWALGVLTFHMMTGRAPFKGSHIAHIAHAIMHGERPRVSTERPDLPPALDAWMECALARDPAQRFASARELCDTLANAFGEVAFTTNRRQALAFGTGPHLPPGFAPPGSQPAPISSPLMLTPSVPITVGTVGNTIDVGATLGPTANTHSPYGSSPRVKWGVMALAMLGVVGIGLAYRFGKQSVASSPPLEATFDAPPAMTAPATAVTPVANATETAAPPPPIVTAPPPSASSVAVAPHPPPPAPPPAVRPVPNRKTPARPPPSPGTKPKGNGAGDSDDVGF
ncbi:MAG: protein kinase [Labilithrix sp.]|nr:protein kinase [Labilithrix sp.]MCW5811788.1 protein kinase [Labilithrix sp.]